MAGEARLLTQVVARSLARATQCVHVQYAPPGAGRQAFGGEWVRSCPGAPAVDATREPINVPVAALNVQRSMLGNAVFDAAFAPSPCSR
jgi:hypothetical protein